jgi:hypothetical protein
LAAVSAGSLAGGGRYPPPRNAIAPAASQPLRRRRQRARCPLPPQQQVPAEALPPRAAAARPLPAAQVLQPQSARQRRCPRSAAAAVAVLVLLRLLRCCSSPAQALLLPEARPRAVGQAWPRPRARRDGEPGHERAEPEQEHEVHDELWLSDSDNIGKHDDRDDRASPGRHEAEYFDASASRTSSCRLLQRCRQPTRR